VNRVGFGAGLRAFWGFGGGFFWRVGGWEGGGDEGVCGKGVGRGEGVCGKGGER